MDGPEHPQDAARRAKPGWSVKQTGSRRDKIPKKSPPEVMISTLALFEKRNGNRWKGCTQQPIPKSHSVMNSTIPQNEELIKNLVKLLEAHRPAGDPL
jgi:hypothetical protein